jgi:hypothetical protein
LTALRANKPHPAASADAWTEGWVKRAENFPEVLGLADTWRWNPKCTYSRAAGLAANGTPNLSPSERSVLTAYALSLNNLRLRNGSAFVWLSVETIALRLNLKTRSVQAINQALEAKGFLIRDYTRNNRRAGNQALDLRPLLARLDELEAEVKRIADAEKARRAAYGLSVLHDDAGWDAEGCTLEQSPKNEVESVTGSVAPSARGSVSGRQASPADDHAAEPNGDSLEAFRPRQAAQGSPRGSVHSGGASTGPAVGAKALQEQLAAALEVCPELQEYVAPRVVEEPSSATPADFARICDAAQALLPEPERNNGQTALWGLQRHGLLVVAMLALALKGRRIQSPCGYFAGLALSDPSRSLDFTLNLANLLRGQGKLPASERSAAQPKPKPLVSAEAAATIIQAPGADNPLWISIAAELRKLVHKGKFDSYCARIGFHGIADGVVRLSAQPTAAGVLRREFTGALRQAVAEAGHDDLRVEIRDRSVHQPNPYGEEIRP